MPYLSNCHTHTLFCDGKVNAEEMAAAARALGCISLGFTAHSPLPTENDWALPWARTGEYLAAVAALRERYQGKMEILTGIELDADTPDSFSLMPYSVVILSLHTLHRGTSAFAVDYTPALFAQGLARMFDGDVAAFWRAYYSALAENLAKPRDFAPGCLRVVGHFDLLTKYNKDGRFFDENDPLYRKIATEALDAILARDPERRLFFEVNTGGMARAGRDVPYPALFLLRELARRGAKMVLNADAHRPEYLCAGFEKALSLLSEAGFREVYRFREDGAGAGARAEALRIADL